MSLQCKRCKNVVAVVKSRKEPFCKDCFIKFVSLKQRKRMMGDDYYRDCFKVVYNKNREVTGNGKILIAFDFNTSSLVALDVVCDVLREQNMQHRGKVGFSLDLVTLYRDQEEFEVYKQCWDKILSNERFSDIVPDKVNLHLLDVNTFYSHNELRQIVLHNVDFSSMGITFQLPEDDQYTVKTLLDSCPNRNTRNDFWLSITQHVIKKFAYQQKHQVIIWCHSMTKMADQIIGLVVKGRGAQIANSLDSESFDDNYGHTFKNLYPLKDILLSEIDAYCIIAGFEKLLNDYVLNDLLMLGRDEVAAEKKKNSNTRLVKNMTINELARKYFDDMENEYSNIIATVMRTGDKLKAPQHGETENQAKCSVCQHTIYTDPSEWLRSIAVLTGHPIETENEKELYEMWRASKTGIEMEEYLALKNNVWANGEKIPLCYGCIINLNGIKSKNIVWPKNDKEELENVLREYEL